MNRTSVPNAFEFVVVASARARQLLNGCLPRVAAAEAAEKKVRIAQREVVAGQVRKSED